MSKRRRNGKNKLSKRKKKDLERTRQKLPLSKEWDRFLEHLSLSDNRIARLVAGALEDPKQCAPKYFLEAVEALKCCIENVSYHAEKIKNYFHGDGNPLYHKDICSALQSFRRHTKTTYDADLKSGMSKEEARRRADEQLRKLGYTVTRTRYE